MIKLDPTLNDELNKNNPSWSMSEPLLSSFYIIEKWKQTPTSSLTFLLLLFFLALFSFTSEWFIILSVLKKDCWSKCNLALISIIIILELLLYLNYLKLFSLHIWIKFKLSKILWIYAVLIYMLISIRIKNIKKWVLNISTCP